MAKKRVHEIAKERGITSKEALEILQKAGLGVTAAASSVEETDAAKAFGNGATATKAPAKPKKAAAKPAAEAPKKQDKPQPARPPIARPPTPEGDVKRAGP